MKMYFERGIEYKLSYLTKSKQDDVRTIFNRLQVVKLKLAESTERNSTIVQKILEEENTVLVVVDFKSHQDSLAELLKGQKNLFIINKNNQMPDVSTIPTEEKKIFIVLRKRFLTGLNFQWIESCTLISAICISNAGLFERALIQHKINKIIQIVDNCPLFKTLNDLITRVSFNHKAIDIDYLKYSELKKWCRK